jgi:hypothetical protein
MYGRDSRFPQLEPNGLSYELVWLVNRSFNCQQDEHFFFVAVVEACSVMYQAAGSFPPAMTLQRNIPLALWSVMPMRNSETDSVKWCSTWDTMVPMTKGCT